MSTETKEYTNGEVTIVWQAHLCCHSTNCWKGLNSVFKPKERPWINATGAESAAILEQVSKCPSGALTAYRNAE
ncbi:MAG: (4Fe-4S)-binding protein [Chitinophagales bacterium]